MSFILDLSLQTSLLLFIGSAKTVDQNASLHNLDKNYVF